MASADDDATRSDTPRANLAAATGDVVPKRYRILAQIGSGGMGQVYRAHDTTLGRDVAVKVINTSALHGPNRTMQRERFVREARAAARLVHRNIAIIHDVDPEAGWLVMELVDGMSLRNATEAGALPVDQVARIATEVLEALAAAHAAGIIHRDVKPSNIMLARDGSVKLVDFGIAQLLDSAITSTDHVVGTPAYMAPEQARGGTTDERTDMYSLGATLYEIVTGELMLAFESPTAAALAKLHAACADRPVLAYVIARCLEADPAARFTSARDALAVLAGSRVPQRRRWLVALAAIVACTALGAGAGIYAGTRHSTARDTRIDQAFLLAQRGENDKALQLLAAYLAEHSDDPNALTIELLATWWQGSLIDDVKNRAIRARLQPAQRAMIEGIDLITQRRDAEAIVYLENAAHDTPNAVEILYALGEAQWHGQHLEQGAVTLARAFALDPRWEMALHHVNEFRLSRGETEQLRPIVAQLTKSDPPAGAALACGIAISERTYDRAVSEALAALARPDLEKTPELYICLAQAQALTGDLDAGTATAKTAFELWPLAQQDRGGFAQYGEFFLYRTQLDAYLELMRGKPSSQRAIALLQLRPTLPVDEPQPAWPGKRMAPLGAATWILQQHVHQIDASSVYSTYPEPEVRGWGMALAAETRGDRDTAISLLRDAIAVAQKGDIHMLLSHRLASLLHAAGDSQGTTSACAEVIRPRFYVNYRAVLLPDCLAWTRPYTRTRCRRRL